MPPLGPASSAGPPALAEEPAPRPVAPPDLRGHVLALGADRAKAYLLAQRPGCPDFAESRCRKSSRCHLLHGTTYPVDPWKEPAPAVTLTGYKWLQPLERVLLDLTGGPSRWPDGCRMTAHDFHGTALTACDAAKSRTPTDDELCRSATRMTSFWFDNKQKWRNEASHEGDPYLFHATSVDVGLLILGGERVVPSEEGTYGGGVYCFAGSPSSEGRDWRQDIGRASDRAASGGYHAGCLLAFRIAGSTFRTGAVSERGQSEMIPNGFVGFGQRQQVVANPTALDLQGVVFHTATLRDALEARAGPAGGTLGTVDVCLPLLELYRGTPHGEPWLAAVIRTLKAFGEHGPAESAEKQIQRPWMLTTSAGPGGLPAISGRPARERTPRRR